MGNRFIEDKISIGKIGFRIPRNIHQESCVPLWPEKYKTDFKAAMF